MIEQRYLGGLSESLEVVPIPSQPGMFMTTLTTAFARGATDSETRTASVKNVAFSIRSAQGVNALLFDAERGVAGAALALVAYHRYWSDQRGETAAEVCAACGYSTASYPCVMSDDGEGDHEPVTVQSISADDAAFLARYDVHAEQGASER